MGDPDFGASDPIPVLETLDAIPVALLGTVLSGVGTFVIEQLHESIITRSKQGAEERTDPVDPVLARESPVNHTRAERSSWV